MKPKIIKSSRELGKFIQGAILTNKIISKDLEKLPPLHLILEQNPKLIGSG